MNEAIMCPLSYEVTAKSGIHGSGFGCGWTGGHCNPGDQCEGYRRLAAKQQRDYDEWIDDETRARTATPAKEENGHDG